MASKAFVQVLYETGGEGKRHHGSDCEEEWQNGGSYGVVRIDQKSTRQQPRTSYCNCYTLSSFCNPRDSHSVREHAQACCTCTDTHTHTHMDIQWMLTATAPCVPSVLRGNLRNGTMRNFRYLTQSFTFLLVKEFKLLLFCESIQHLRLIYQLTLRVCYPEPVVQLNQQRGPNLLFRMQQKSRSQVNT